jgi:hypothetical protein
MGNLYSISLLSFLLLFACVPTRLGALSDYARTTNGDNQVAPWLKWGPYRPNLYFGVRPQIPDTLLMGLMWASGDDQQEMLKSKSPLRFTPLSYLSLRQYFDHQRYLRYLPFLNTLLIWYFSFSV